jgi:hypothetical protein
LNANYAKVSALNSYALKSYVDTQISSLINSAPTTLNTLSEIATALQSDASFGVNVYAKITSSDASINSIRSDYATTASLSSYATTLYTDNSLNLIRNKYDASFTSLYTSDTTLNGNLTLGSGNKSIGINKQPSSLFSLDVSGSTQITGYLTVSGVSTSDGVSTSNPITPTYLPSSIVSTNIGYTSSSTNNTFTQSVAGDYTIMNTGSIFSGATGGGRRLGLSTVSTTPVNDRTMGVATGSFAQLQVSSVFSFSTATTVYLNLSITAALGSAGLNFSVLRWTRIA